MSCDFSKYCLRDEYTRVIKALREFCPNTLLCADQLISDNCSSFHERPLIRFYVCITLWQGCCWCGSHAFLEQLSSTECVVAYAFSKQLSSNECVVVHRGTVQWQLRQDDSAAVVKLCYEYMHTLVYTQQRHAVRTPHASLADIHADAQKDSVPNVA